MSSITSSPLNDRFRKLLELIRERTGHSKTRIAENLGVDRAALSHLASGRSKAPSRQTLALLKERYGVEEAWLLVGADPVFRGLTGAWHEPNRFRPDPAMSQLRLPDWMPDPFAGNQVNTPAMRSLLVLLTDQLGENSRGLQALTTEVEELRHVIEEMKK